MRVQLAEKGSPKVDLAIVPVFEGEALAPKSYVGESRAKLAKREQFSGKKDQSLLLVDHDATAPRLLLMGMGPDKNTDPLLLAKIAQKSVRQARDLKAKTLALVLPKAEHSAEMVRNIAEAAILGLYRFRKYQTAKADDKANPELLILIGAQGAKTAQALQTAAVRSQAVILARNWVNTPPSDLSPAVFVAEAKKALKGIAGLSLKVLDAKACQRLGMGGLIGVGRGSDMPPAFIHITYKPWGKAKAKVALVGKGVTFDSGGLSLKPAGSMEDMKCDMSGAAAVIATLQAAARLQLPVELHGLCALVENMPSGHAMKPGDVLTAMNGKTIEVLNTDAEGRLILADALVYAARLKPDFMLDMATLTGAAIVALGSELFAVMGDDGPVKRVLEASKRSGEPCWELPMVESYKEHIKSRLADLKNIGKSGQAGTIIGGLFLKEFTGSVPWAHLDIAGPAHMSAEAGLLPAGGTGVPVRTLLELLSAL
jgi:leucyl aminopeptidase